MSGTDHDDTLDGSERPSVAGSLLVAHPGLKDENFRHAVLLISEHDAEGAMGVILNRPLRRTMGNLSPDLAMGPLSDVPLFQGGPVQTEQLLICAWRISADGAGFRFFFGLDPERAIGLMAQPGVHVRGFLGYSGWSSGQLEGELDAGGWVTLPIPSNLMSYEADEGLWRGVLCDTSAEWALLVNEPDDPSRN